jgi:hypothetical protein
MHPDNLSRSASPLSAMHPRHWPPMAVSPRARATCPQPPPPSQHLICSDHVCSHIREPLPSGYALATPIVRLLSVTVMVLYFGHHHAPSPTPLTASPPPCVGRKAPPHRGTVVGPIHPSLECRCRDSLLVIQCAKQHTSCFACHSDSLTSFQSCRSTQIPSQPHHRPPLPRHLERQ